MRVQSKSEIQAAMKKAKQSKKEGAEGSSILPAEPLTPTTISYTVHHPLTLGRVFKLVIIAIVITIIFL